LFLHLSSVLESVILVQRWQGEAKIRYLTYLGRYGLCFGTEWTGHCEAGGEGQRKGGFCLRPLVAAMVRIRRWCPRGQTRLLVSVRGRVGAQRANKEAHG
jgi:hypothetical protein